MNFQDTYQFSIDDPETFWAKAAEDIDWDKPWDRVLDDSNIPFYRWFKGAKLNTCYNAIDRHVEQGRADQDALIYDSPVTNTQRRYSYREMRDEIARLAGVLKSLGVEKGDRVLIYMPMIPEAVMGMLASA
jgi:propionyl-CoA synthetase